ncbi:EAL domain-containing protein [Pandoraea sputorum]|uniref:EAL domain-containing protein n=1 Tax=Pandoraea sputorum TaxID=93222 RepID=UPI0012412A70|nr:EAL domain-containing protein [Pandoraea sputorum]VVE55369.1 diguanylate cyclase [Pandoraea sputorum]
MLSYLDHRTSSVCAHGVDQWCSALFAGFSHAVVVKDAHSRVRYVNAPACAMLGCPAHDIVGRTDREFLTAARAERSVRVDRDVLASGETRTLEESVTDADGRCRTLLTRKQRVVVPGSGEPLVLAVITDVTELRQAERWRHGEAHYRALMELLPQVAWVANAAGEVIEVGPTWTRLSGRAPEAAYGTGWEAAVHPDDLPGVRERWRVSVATAVPLDVECRVRGLDGEFRWFRNRAAARHDEHGAAVRWYGLLEDVHERKSAEQALRESEGRFRLMADSVPVMIWLTDGTGSTVYRNRSWYESTGQTVLQALGRGWLDAVHPEDRERVHASVERARAARTGMRVEYRLRRPDGSWAWVIDVGVPRLDAQGAMLGFAGSILDLTERKAAQTALEESEACIRSIFDSSPDCIWLLDLDGEPLLMNDAARGIFGATCGAQLAQAPGPRVDSLVDACDAAKAAQAFARVRQGHVARFEATVTTHDRQRICVDVFAAPVLGKQGKPMRMLTIWRDITGAKAAREAAEEARRAAELAAAKLATVLESTMDCVAVLDRTWRLTYLNANARHLLALDDEALGHSFWSLFPQERHGAFAAQYEKALAANEPVTFEDYLASLDRWLEVHAAPTEDGLAIFFRDTSARQRAEQERFQVQARMLHMSRHDALTNLPNRWLLRERLERSLARLENGARLAVLTLDLDGFKAVNDTYGHSVGDLLLRQLADRLRACVHEEDTVARLGGDEFVVVRPRARHTADVGRLAKRIVAALQQPFDLEGVSVRIGASVGMALTPEAGTSVDELIRASDVALFRAKAQGVGMTRFAPGMDAPMQARQALKAGLRSALAHHELELFFQPLVDLASQRVCSCEALLRWRHPDKGMVSPVEFIPIAEECGLIVPIGEWVLHAACHEAARWADDIAVAVNLSPVQFNDGNLVSTVSAALAASGLAAPRLQLEITESVMLEQNDTNVRTLQELRRLGVKIAMDDFGTAYASLGHLRTFPFDKIKLDRTFIGDLPHGRESLAIVRAMVGIGRSLGMTTTVEGVETQAQLDAVHAEGFDEAQGYLFSRPVPAAELAALLHRLAGAGLPRQASVSGG